MVGERENVCISSGGMLRSTTDAEIELLEHVFVSHIAAIECLGAVSRALGREGGELSQSLCWSPVVAFRRICGAVLPRTAGWREGVAVSTPLPQSFV
ncbi:hypothetical protein CDAR_608091 [Caerostris darwini]|uniref:Uncharacterized protein n=1 Tax=Caerostris darwini TaxID=1538125 RepID=A0AAV4Q3U1_9ARAC|nr:hypothetical protein CDAR_608091 [Caerostris darwini]